MEVDQSLYCSRVIDAVMSVKIHDAAARIKQNKEGESLARREGRKNDLMQIISDAVKESGFGHREYV